MRTGRVDQAPASMTFTPYHLCHLNPTPPKNSRTQKSGEPVGPGTDSPRHLTPPPRLAAFHFWHLAGDTDPGRRRVPNLVKVASSGPNVPVGRWKSFLPTLSPLSPPCPRRPQTPPGTPGASIHAGLRPGVPAVPVQPRASSRFFRPPLSCLVPNPARPARRRCRTAAPRPAGTLQATQGQALQATCSTQGPAVGPCSRK